MRPPDSSTRSSEYNGVGSPLIQALVSPSSTGSAVPPTNRNSCLPWIIPQLLESSSSINHSRMARRDSSTNARGNSSLVALETNT